MGALRRRFFTRAFRVVMRNGGTGEPWLDGAILAPIRPNIINSLRQGGDKRRSSGQFITLLVYIDYHCKTRSGEHRYQCCRPLS